jgi:hypothetical protein
VRRSLVDSGLCALTVHKLPNAFVGLVWALAPARMGCVRVDPSGHPIGVLGRATWAFQVEANRRQDQG